eukprot:3320110-Amphidinium_carterae.2
MQLPRGWGLRHQELDLLYGRACALISFCLLANTCNLIIQMSGPVDKTCSKMARTIRDMEIILYKYKAWSFTVSSAKSNTCAHKMHCQAQKPYMLKSQTWLLLTIACHSMECA